VRARSLYRERGEAVGALVVERDPLAGLGVLPDDEVAVEELERGGAAGVEVLDEGDGVPVIPPRELLPGLGRRRARLRLAGDGRRRGHAQAGARAPAADVAGNRGHGEGREPRPMVCRPWRHEQRRGGDCRAHFSVVKRQRERFRVRTVEILAAPARFMLGGGNGWLGVGSGAVVLDDGRTEFWHAGGTTRGPCACEEKLAHIWSSSLLSLIRFSGIAQICL
jgi:hypothetical protein